MTAETAFSILNVLPLPGWALLVFLPHRQWATLVAGTVLPLVLSVSYLTFFALHWGESQGSFTTLEGVAQLFSNRWLLLAGWVHYLAFDLVVGTWEARDGVARSLSRWIVGPCLILTLFFGPIGFLCYHVVRTLTGRGGR
jgi:hypothetical protein